jgi:hypothetical protein
VDPRTVWIREDHQFTPWLAQNLTLLNEALGLEIELTGTEKPVGGFAVDIYAREVGSGHEVIIENQLAATDHGHLGQLLTYASGLDARIIVWISPQFRDEHRQALEWLNRETSESVSFFGVELELLRIDDSAPAPNFKLVAQPSEWQKAVKTRSEVGTRQFSQRQIEYNNFFTDLVSKIHERMPAFTNVRRIGYDSWIHFATGRSGFAFSVAFTSGNRFRVELEIDTGDYDKNRSAFGKLSNEKEALEAVLGQLIWDFKEGRRAQRIYTDRGGTVDSPAEMLKELKDWAIETLMKFRDVLTPRVRALMLEEGSTDE